MACRGRRASHAIRLSRARALCRVDVGGKALTNQLKEVVSYKQLSVKNETYIMNECKEKTCFVSTDVKADMKAVM